jgi:hypothetical protein
MKKKFYIFITFTFFSLFLAKPVFAGNTQGQDNLTIDFNTSSATNTEFNATNISPGFTESRNIILKNEGKTPIVVYVKGSRTGPNNQTDPKLETMMDFQILEGSTILYSQKLSKFFSDSADLNNIKLITLSSGQSQTLTFKSSLPSTTNNSFQGKSVVFSISFSDTSQSSPVISNPIIKIVVIIITNLEKLFKLF